MARGQSEGIEINWWQKKKQMSFDPNKNSFENEKK